MSTSESKPRSLAYAISSIVVFAAIAAFMLRSASRTTGGEQIFFLACAILNLVFIARQVRLLLKNRSPAKATNAS
jgi:hypothetical protein